MNSAIITNSYYIQGRIDGEKGLPFGFETKIDLLQLQEQNQDNFVFYCKGYASIRAEIDYDKHIISPTSNWPKEARDEYDKQYKILEIIHQI